MGPRRGGDESPASSIDPLDCIDRLESSSSTHPHASKRPRQLLPHARLPGARENPPKRQRIESVTVERRTSSAESRSPSSSASARTPSLRRSQSKSRSPVKRAPGSKARSSDLPAGSSSPARATPNAVELPGDFPTPPSNIPPAASLGPISAAGVLPVDLAQAARPASPSPFTFVPPGRSQRDEEDSVVELEAGLDSNDEIDQTDQGDADIAPPRPLTPPSTSFERDTSADTELDTSAAEQTGAGDVRDTPVERPPAQKEEDEDEEEEGQKEDVEPIKEGRDPPVDEDTRAKATRQRPQDEEANGQPVHSTAPSPETLPVAHTIPDVDGRGTPVLDPVGKTDLVSSQDPTPASQELNGVEGDAPRKDMGAENEDEKKEEERVQRPSSDTHHRHDVQQPALGTIDSLRASSSDMSMDVDEPVAPISLLPATVAASMDVDGEDAPHDKGDNVGAPVTQTVESVHPDAAQPAVGESIAAVATSTDIAMGGDRSPSPRQSGATSAAPLPTEDVEGEDEIDPDERGIMDVEAADKAAAAVVEPPTTSSEAAAASVAPTKDKKKTAPKSSKSENGGATTPSSTKGSSKKSAKAKGKTKVEEMKASAASTSFSTKARSASVSESIAPSVSSADIAVATPPPQPVEDTDELFCICRKVFNEDDEEGVMVGCDGCNDWFHPSCIGVPEEEVELIDTYICAQCEKGTSQRTSYRRICKRDTCSNSVGSKSSKYCSSTCAFQHMATQIPVAMSSKLLKHMSTSFIGLPRPQNRFETTHHIPIPAAGDPVDPISMFEEQIAAVDQALTVVTKRRQILEEVLARCEASTAAQPATAAPVASKSSKKKGSSRATTEDRPCGWSERLIWTDEEVASWDRTDVPPAVGGGETDEAMAPGDPSQCSNPRRRCDRHQGWQKTIPISLDIEQAHLDRRKGSLQREIEMIRTHRANDKASQAAKKAMAKQLSARPAVSD